MIYYFPPFLKLVLFIWAILIIVFIIFTIFIYHQPNDYVDRIKAQAIENKKRLGIKIYRMR